MKRNYKLVELRCDVSRGSFAFGVEFINSGNRADFARHAIELKKGATMPEVRRAILKFANHLTATNFIPSPEKEIPMPRAPRPRG